MQLKNNPILGIHHVTAMSGDPQTNVAFYTGVLGLRLVKLTVNYDDPGTYHLYYGDGVGSPGTILTFFPWPNSMNGRNGAGMVTEIAFSAPPQALEFWQKRLNEKGVAAVELGMRFGERTLTFADPDGLRLAIVGSAPVPAYQDWDGAAISSEHALQGIHSATLTESDPVATAQHLVQGMDFKSAGQEGERRRFTVGEGGAGRTIDVWREDQAPHGRISAGTVHHLAWRVADDDTELLWQERLSGEGRHVSPVMDRTYFHSIYWREPGGVLFEIATDSPGFAVDEPLESLGEKLILPRWLEPMRADLERRLPHIEMPFSTAKGGK